MYLISVYFDDNTTKQLKRYIDAIARATGNTYMVDNNVPPHMTISSFEMREVNDLVDDFRTMSAKLVSGTTNIVTVGQFLPYVMFAQPVLNNYLQTISENVYEMLKGRSDVSISKCYQPYSWIPHITLGKQLDKEQMEKAFKTMQESFAHIEGRIEKIGLARTNPHRDIVTFDLT